jgi:hypothetical protein
VGLRLPTTWEGGYLYLGGEWRTFAQAQKWIAEKRPGRPGKKRE